MALNWKINVASPILTQGMSFQIRYRKIGSPNWNNLLPNPTVNEFIIYNLENGDYEAEIRTVCANGDLSNPVFHTTQIESCPIVTDLTFTENTVDPSSYEYRSFNFMWTKVEGKTYRLEFQKNGVMMGTNDNASGMNVPNVPVTVYGLALDKVRVVTICSNNTETPSAWVNVLQSTLPTQSFYYKAMHPDGHGGYDRVVYLDKYGIQREEILIRAHWEQDVWVSAPCTKIEAVSIVEKLGVIACTDYAS